MRRCVLWGFSALVAAFLGWLILTGILVRSQLSDLQGRLDRVQTLAQQGQVGRASNAAKPIPAMARRLHSLTSGPAWWFGAHLPIVGEPLQVTRGMTAASEQLSDKGLPGLIDLASAIDPAHLRTGSGNGLKLNSLAAAAPELARAAVVVRQSQHKISDLPSGTWLAPVNSERSKLSAQLGTLSSYIDAGSRAAQVLPEMLGLHRTQRIFIGLQNEAELRGTGGLPGAFAVVTARNGVLQFTHFESDSALLPVANGLMVRTGLNFGREYDQLYGASSPTSSYVDSNASPEFPFAARIWADMWQHVSGERIDHVLALDPQVLSYFLYATGPVAIPNGGGTITAANVVPLTESVQYSVYPNNAQRKKYIVSVLRAVAAHVLSMKHDDTAVLRAASQSAKERRLLVWSRSTALESLLSQTSYAGVLPRQRPLSAAILNNASGGKVDYYLRRTLKYERTGCGPMRDVRVSLTLSNTTPASGLPQYVVGRADDPPRTARPGDSHLLLDYYTAAAAQLQSVEINGRASAAASYTVSDHGVFRLDLELPRGTTVTVMLHLKEPAGKGNPVIWRQPGVTPLAVQEFNQSC